MKNNPVHSSIALFLIVLISAAIIGWIAYREKGTLSETVEAGTEGIRKAEEIKRLLEESSQSLP